MLLVRHVHRASPALILRRVVQGRVHNLQLRTRTHPAAAIPSAFFLCDAVPARVEWGAVQDPLVPLWKACPRWPSRQDVKPAQLPSSRQETKGPKKQICQLCAVRCKYKGCRRTTFHSFLRSSTRSARAGFCTRVDLLGVAFPCDRHLMEHSFECCRHSPGSYVHTQMLVYCRACGRSHRGRPGFRFSSSPTPKHP